MLRSLALMKTSKHEILYHSIYIYTLYTGYEHNFQKRPRSIASTRGVKYDFDSIMHYGAYDFAKNRNEPVITPKTNDQITGQRTHLTKQDLMHIFKVYCPNWLDYYHFDFEDY